MPESLVDVLESYRGRDKVIRTLCYGTQLVGGLLSQKARGSSELGKSLLLFSAELSNCRTVLRLFDDLSMFAYSWNYGLGASENDPVLRWMSVMNNLADQLYYPFEHVAWAADAKIIGVKSENWWTLSTLLWGVSLLLGILRSIRVLLVLKKRLEKNGRTRQTNSNAGVNVSVAVQGELLSLLSSMADLCNAIHWMPPGFLWGGYFPSWLVGLLGTTSSLLGLHRMCVSDAGSGV